MYVDNKSSYSCKCHLGVIVEKCIVIFCHVPIYRKSTDMESRALDNIGRVYAVMGQYQSAAEQ